MRVLVCVVLVGCGRLRFDARADAAPCTWSRFSAPQKLPAIVQSTLDDWWPTPTAGETEIFFYSYRDTTSPHARIWHAPIDPYAAAVEESELDEPNDTKFPTLSEDSLDLIYGNDPSKWELWETTRVTPANAFALPARIPELASTSNDYAPSLTPDGLRLVFASDRDGSDIAAYETTRATRTSPFAPPVQLSELGQLGPIGAIFPGVTLSSDALDIWLAMFSADNHFHIFTAHRAMVGATFSTPVKVPELSSTADDGGQHLSVDGATMWLNYDSVAGGGMNADLWSATRTCD